MLKRGAIHFLLALLALGCCASGVGSTVIELTSTGVAPLAFVH
jgi:hypothetical protein